MNLKAAQGDFFRSQSENLLSNLGPTHDIFALSTLKLYSFSARLFALASCLARELLGMSVY
jgi:hypothetical protein